jgi:isocitrate dehydrogenase
MTRDLARLMHGTMNPPRESWVTTEEYITAVAAALR